MPPILDHTSDQRSQQLSKWAKNNAKHPAPHSLHRTTTATLWSVWKSSTKHRIVATNAAICSVSLFQPLLPLLCAHATTPSSQSSMAFNRNRRCRQQLRKVPEWCNVPGNIFFFSELSFIFCKIIWIYIYTIDFEFEMILNEIWKIFNMLYETE